MRGAVVRTFLHMTLVETVFGTLRRLDPARTEDWDALYADQLPRVLNYFRYRFGNETLAEDLTSQTFEKAWGARHRYRHDLAAFSTWLMTIARNVGVDHHRRRREHLPLEAADAVADASDPQARVEARESLERLVRLIERLPDRDQELIALKYGAELDHRAIGRQLGLSETHVGSLAHRIVTKLRSAIESEGSVANG